MVLPFALVKHFLTSLETALPALRRMYVNGSTEIIGCYY